MACAIVSGGVVRDEYASSSMRAPSACVSLLTSVAKTVTSIGALPVRVRAATRSPMRSATVSGEPVVVRPEQRQAPQRMRPERLLRLQAQHEVLEIVEPFERGHRPGERPGRRSVDPADARPEIAPAQAQRKPSSMGDAVDGAAREDDCDVAFHRAHLRSVTKRYPIFHGVAENLVDRFRVSAASETPDAAALASTCSGRQAPTIAEATFGFRRTHASAS